MITVLLAMLVATGATPEEVEFVGWGDFKLQGVLMRPTGDGLHPAILLLPGSGPTDRNGNQPPALVTNLLRDLSDALVEAGFVTLRFDKRAVASRYATAFPPPSEFPTFFGWDAFVGDVAAAVTFLRGVRGVHPDRVGILGHSEGGSLALAVAEQMRPRLLILAGTPGRPMDVVILEQVESSLQRQGLPEGIREQFTTATRRIMDAIAANGEVPGDVPTGLQALFPPYIGPYFQGWIRQRPETIAGRLPIATAVVALNGEHDVQVSAERDLGALERALRARGGPYETRVIAGASHNLKAVNDPNEPGFAGPVHPDALRTIVAAARRYLAAP